MEKIYVVTMCYLPYAEPVIEAAFSTQEKAVAWQKPCEVCKVEHCPGCWEAPIVWLDDGGGARGFCPASLSSGRLPARQALWDMLVDRRWPGLRTRQLGPLLHGPPL